MKKASFANAEFASKKRRERFLAEMDVVVQWSRLEALIDPHYSESGKVCRPPIRVPRLLLM